MMIFAIFITFFLTPMYVWWQHKQICRLQEYVLLDPVLAAWVEAPAGSDAKDLARRQFEELFQYACKR